MYGGDIQHRQMLPNYPSPTSCHRCFINHPILPLQPTLIFHDSTAVSESSFLRFPFGAGFMRGVYVTVLVTTSRICRMLDLDSLFACVGVLGQLAVGVSGCAGRLQPDPWVSVKRRVLSAFSQSKGECTEAALNGDMGE